MKELEEVNCEIRRIVDLQHSVSNRLRNLETEEQSAFYQEHDIKNYGGFLHNAAYAWLSCGAHFVVFNVKTGESVSNWIFRYTVTSVSQFPAQPGDLPLLLVGLDNNASKPKDSSGLLCIFDCAVSRVLRAIRMPCGIGDVCIVSGGTEWEEFNDKRPDNILHQMDGVACVVLRNLQHIMVDLRRSTWDIHDLFAVMDESSPAEIDLSTCDKTAKQVRHRPNQEKHTAYNLLNSRIEKLIGFNRTEFESSSLLDENMITTIISSTKIGCLISGCLGRVIIWQNDGSVEWISAPIDENMVVTHLALLEPTDDPRPFYYLWVVFQDGSSSRAPPVLRMYAMLFQRKYCDRGINLYFNLEADLSLKFEFELSGGDRVVDLCTVERESNPEQTESGVKRGEDNLLLIATNERTLLFDLNQWYKEQMPRTIDECQNPNSILAIYRTRPDVSQQSDSYVVSFIYVPLSLQEFPSNSSSSPEELFYPNSLSLEWMELSPKKLTFWVTRGIQADLLREMAITGPIILIQPSEMFHRCLSVGLVPFNTEFSFASDQNAQREMLLSLCLEQRWSTFLIKCAIEWSDGSASYMYPIFLKWGVQRASAIKMLADRLCVPLFDQSGSGIGEADVKTLRFCSQQLECLSNVVAKIPLATIDLTKQRRTLKRVSTYFQVLLWFYDVGLLPETQNMEEESTLPISLALKVPYPYEKLSTLYKEKRIQVQANKINTDDKNEEEESFIDELITRECFVLKGQWEREGGIMGGCYPPPSLQSLLRNYLTDCHNMESHEINCKHQITIYLLMDLAMLLQRVYPGVDQLIKYPSAFKMSPSLIKLTQAFWLLDHEDYHGFLDMMTGQLVSDSDVKDWHHRLVLRILMRNNQHKLALVYLRVRKPPLSSVEEQGIVVSLSVEHGLVQSAFHRRPPCHYEQLLTSFFRACKIHGKLDQILHLTLEAEEEEVFVKFLEENKREDLRLLYYLQRCRYTEAINSSHYPKMVHYQSSVMENIQSTFALGMLGAYNTTLPDITKCFSANTAALNLDTDLETRYPRPMSHCKSHDWLRGIHETVISKARETYLRGDKWQIPFVSAPCISLKLNNHGANVNCVLFPTLLRKNSHGGKRTVDQIYEKEDADDSMKDDAKRRKLSDGNTSPSDSNGIKELGLSRFATFDTPLVKRKFNASNNKDDVSETPQSILKIRHLITNSVSPGVTTSLQEKDVKDGPIDKQEKEKKISRQIRFNVSQSENVFSEQEEEEEEEEQEKKKKEEKEEEEEKKKAENKNRNENTKEEETEEKKEEKKYENKDDNKLDVSVGKDDVYLSPNENGKSYCESAVLSGNSSDFSRSYYCPRPRRSLRRSALQTSVESLQKSPLNRTTSNTLSISLPAATFPNSDETIDRRSVSTANITRRRSSFLSMASAYSTTMLTSNSSVEISGYSLKNLEEVSPQSHWRLSDLEKDHKNKFVVSSTPLTKKITVPQGFFNDKRTRKRCDDKDEEERENKEKEKDIESPLRKTHKMNEILDIPSESKKSSNIERFTYGKSDLVEQQTGFEGNVQSEQSECKYNNGNIIKRKTLQNPYEEESLFSEFEKVTEPNPIVLDESEEELFRLRDDEEEEDDVFESLSMEDIPKEAQEENEIPVSHLPETNNPSRRMELHDHDTKSNGLGESVQLTHDISFTDDESTGSRNMTPVMLDKLSKNEKERYSTSATHLENILYNMSNITDDESDSNIKDIEKPKTKSSKLSGLSKQQMTKQCIVTMEGNDELDKKNQEPSTKKTTSKKSASETRTLPNVESEDKLTRKRKKSQIDPEDSQSSIRVTRASSLAKDVATDTSLSQLIETERVTRSRRANSMAKDLTWMDSPSRDVSNEKPSRPQRASSKNSRTESPLLENTHKPPRLRRVDSSTLDTLTDSLSEETNPQKMPRLRRASSAKDIASSLVKPRTRRATSLAKELLTCSVMIKNIEPTTSSESLSSVTASTKRGHSRSKSVTKEILQSENKDSDSESVKNEPSVRRSTRLTSSARKESQADVARSHAKSEASFSKLASDDEENQSMRKRSLRATRSSVSSADTVKMTTRGSSLSSMTDLEEQPELAKIGRRQRSSSLPKEIMVQTGRKRRSSSIIKEIIPEDAELSLVTSRRLRSAKNTIRVDSPAINTRTRSTSIQSVPEELEEILSQTSSRETRSAARKQAALARERRAASEDILHKVTKRIRSIRTKNVVAEPILEESAVENEERIKFEEGETEKMDSKGVERNVAPGRRKRAESITTTTVVDDAKEDETVEQSQDRTRRMSINDESSNIFSFSQPDKMIDAPLDEKDIGEVPSYVFSSPQTRSKDIFQHRRLSDD